MEFEAKTVMILKHILYTLLCEIFSAARKKCPVEKWKREDHFAT